MPMSHGRHLTSTTNQVITLYFTLFGMAIIMLQVIYTDCRTAHLEWIGVLDFDPLVFQDVFDYEFIHERT